MLLLTISAVNTYGQNGFQDSFNIGIEGGIQFSDVSDAYVTDTKSGMGPNIGAFLEYSKWNALKLRLGLNYDNRGFTSISSIYPIRIGDSVGYNSYYVNEIDYRNQYLTIPFSLVYIKGDNKFKVFVKATVYYSILLQAKQDGSGLLYIDPEDAPKFADLDEPLDPGNHHYIYDGEVTEQFNSYDFGIGIFLGLSYQISPKMMLQFSPGFLESFADVYADPTKSSDWSGQFQLNLGLVYQFKAK